MPIGGTHRYGRPQQVGVEWSGGVEARRAGRARGWGFLWLCPAELLWPSCCRPDESATEDGSPRRPTHVVSLTPCLSLSSPASALPLQIGLWTAWPLAPSCMGPPSSPPPRPRSGRSFAQPQRHPSEPKKPDCPRPRNSRQPRPPNSLQPHQRNIGSPTSATVGSPARATVGSPARATVGSPTSA
eukprot:scaffold869_cov105-Isochrysis_galbana.AAC.26